MGSKWLIIVVLMFCGIYFQTVDSLDCYVCKSALNGYTGPVNCSNFNNAETVIHQNCPSGVCLTFRGTQTWNAHTTHGGVVRICADESKYPDFKASMVAGACSMYTFSRSQSGGVSVALSGELCACRTNLCNSQFPSNTASSKNFAFLPVGILLSVVAHYYSLALT